MSNKGEYTKLQERGEGGKRTQEQKENDEEIQEQEKGFMADGFCEHLAHDQQVRYLSIVAVQFGFAFASLVSGFQLNFLCTTFAVGFFVFKTFTSHSKNVIGWWRRLMKAIKNKAEFKEIAFEVVQAPLFVFGDILDVKLDIINAYRMIGFYTNFTITMASFFATASQTSIAAALPCLVAFDFLRDIFDKEKASFIFVSYLLPASNFICS